MLIKKEALNRFSLIKAITALIINKIKFSSYIRKFRVEEMRKCANISSYMRRPLVIYDFATAPL
jgi:hypothetical protein